MSGHTCPNGHQSSMGDWCDMCGTAISATVDGLPDAAQLSGVAKTVLSGGTRTCANCSEENPADGLFCEVCGADFTTGELPPVVPGTAGGNLGANAAAGGAVADVAAGVEWVAEVWVDPDWYQTRRTDDTAPCPTPGMPSVVGLLGGGVVIGRESSTAHPDVSCGADPGVSRQHARLSFDSGRWFVEDLSSTNGTFIGVTVGQLPDKQIVAGHRIELADNSRVYVGAWTRIVVRAAIGDERN